MKKAIITILLFTSLSSIANDDYTIKVTPQKNDESITYDSMSDKEFYLMIEDMKKSSSQDEKALQEECKAARDFNSSSYFSSMIKSMVLINCVMNGVGAN